MKVASIVGARPQFIKAAPVSKALQESKHQEILLHTGQHYDYEMSNIFFEELNLKKPDINLGVGSGPHGRQTGEMLAAIEQVLLEAKPDWVLLYGDTNSTLAGALAAVKLHIPIAHVEAGLRSFNRQMPEEINRIVTDCVSTLLFCPMQRAVNQLAAEGVTEGVVLSGDVMLDAFEHDRRLARMTPSVLERLGLMSGDYILMTMHRAANTDNPEMCRLRLAQVGALDRLVVWSIHPRAVAALRENGGRLPANLRPIEAMGRLAIIQLMEGASAVVTDSGGLQKEAYWARVPCFTLRQETEWVETVEAGWNSLISTEPGSLREAIESWKQPAEWPEIYGHGQAAQVVASSLTYGAKTMPANSMKSAPGVCT